MTELAVVAVDDPDDPRVRPFTRLTDGELRRALEAEHGWFIAEGLTVLARLVTSRFPLAAVLCAPRKLDAVRAALVDAPPGAAGAGDPVPVYVAAQPVLDAVTGFSLHRGVVALGRRVDVPWPADARRVAVLDGLNDTENVGSIVRSASALGIDALVLCPRSADPLHRRALRVSMGEALHLPWRRVDDLPGWIAAWRAGGGRAYALAVQEGSVPITALAPDADARVAVVLGAEYAGVSAPAREACDACVRIPMRPGADSLNVGAAAAIAFHHLGTDRR